MTPRDELGAEGIGFSGPTVLEDITFAKSGRTVLKVCEQHYQTGSSTADCIMCELEHFKSSGVIEVAIRNAPVAEYMRHWEGRTEKAERKLQEARVLLAQMLADHDRSCLGSLCPFTCIDMVRASLTASK